MRPTPEDLDDPGRYALLESIDHADLIPAVQAHLRRSSPVKAAYVAANVAVVAALGFAWARSGVSFGAALSNVCLGMALGYLLLLPIHEATHALAYRALGARWTRVVYTWRNLSAYCVADRFVVDGSEFVAVCLAPFLVINSALLVALAVAGGFAPILWGMLLLHVGACSGDFAFVNLAWARRGDGLQTYDDVAAGRTLFFLTRPTTSGETDPERVGEASAGHGDEPDAAASRAEAP